MKKQTKFPKPERFIEIRNNLDLTQTEMAEAGGTTLRQVQFLEGGDRQFTMKWARAFTEGLHALGFTDITPWMFFSDPAQVLSEEDRDLLDRYHALPENLKAAVDAILSGKQT